MSNALLTIAVAVAAALPCALLGCFLLLKRMSLLADAIGHGVLPGIALAAMGTLAFHGKIDTGFLMAGATVCGLLTAVLAQWLTERAGVSSDASLGVVFTSLFAVGVLLLSVFLRNSHVDQHCVAFSSLDLTPLFTTPWLGVPVPDAVWPPLAVLAVVLAFFTFGWKELKLATFDPGLAVVQGLPVRSIHYAIAGLTAAATVAAFEAFGSVLVLGLFVVPPATARLMTDRLAPMLALSAVAAVLACIAGYVLASPEVLGCNASGMIVVAAGLGFFAALLFARHGVVPAFVRRTRLTRRMAEEEILAAMFRSEESPTEPKSPTDHAFTKPVLTLANWNLRRKKLVADRRLTDLGRAEARSIVRSHRLWETYLEKNFDLPLDHLHASATEIEHFLGPELQAELARELAAPNQDPHGKSIPK